MKKLYILMMLFLAMGSDSFAGTYSGGDGTSGNPYLISTLDDLHELSSTSADWAAGIYFQQIANIIFNPDPALVDWDGDGTLEPAGDDALGFSPIGSWSTPFDGQYNGQNFTIANLMIDRQTTYNVGLFGYAGKSNTPVISNLTLSNVDITALGSLAGLVGGTYGITLDNCHVSGVVESVDQTNGYQGVALLLGNAQSQQRNTNISNCSSSGTVIGTVSYSAGLVGRLDAYPGNISISNCFSTANVTMTDYVNYRTEYAAGLLGNAGVTGGSSLTISGCYATGNVITTQAQNPSYPTSRIGGLIGMVANYGAGTLTIDNVYARGDVSGDAYTGGLIGWYYSTSTLNNAYSTGQVTGRTTDYIGGLVGRGGGVTNNSFWDVETSGIGSDGSTAGSYGGTGKSTANMKNQSTFTNAGWDFVNTWTINASVNRGYPYLQNNEPAIYWTGAAGSSWNMAGSWVGNAVPTAANNIVIQHAMTSPVISWGDGANCKNLLIYAEATLTINDGGSLITEGTITNNGTVNMVRNYSDERWLYVSPTAVDAMAGVFTGNYLMEYEESTNTWLEIIDPATPLTTGKGYALWSVGKGSFTFTGTPNNGDFSTNYTYTPVGNPEHYGYNLVGNPYPSFLDWDQLNESYGAVYHWDGSAYQSWNGTGTGSSVIWPGEGFIIAPGSEGSLNLNNSYRTHAEMAKDSKVTENEIIIHAANDLYSDELHIVFNDGATAEFDLLFDAWKFMTSKEKIPQVYSIMGEKKLSIDQQPSCEQIPVGFTCSESGNYTFSIGESTFDGPVYLEDTKTGIIHDLRLGSYTFLYEKDENDNRFILHFTPMGIGNMENSQPFSIYASGNTIHVSAPDIQNRMQVHVYDLTGQAMATTTVRDASKAEVNVSCQTGIYLVTVISDNKTFTQKIYLK